MYGYGFLLNLLVYAVLASQLLIDVAKSKYTSVLKSAISDTAETAPIYTALLINIAIKGIYSKDITLTELVLPTARSYAFNHNNYENRLIVIYLEGLVDITNGFTAKGKEQVMNLIGEEGIAQGYQTYFQEQFTD